MPRGVSSHPLLEIPELVSLTAGQGLVRLPPEQNVPFTPRVRALVDTLEFQRLSRISQLGLVARVYPGARHTRFEHSLGVFHNSLKYLWQLGHDPRFTKLVDTHSAEVLMVAALLHDVGHWPSCHLIEDLSLPGLPAHEDFAREFLQREGDLSRVLHDDWGLSPGEVLEVLCGTSETPTLKLLRSILSGPVDIDKLDYLERDSLHCGVPYGRNFDKQRLIQALILNANGDGLALTSKGRTAAELMVFARYVMFSEVYWHHAVRAATAMFARAFFELLERTTWQTLFLEGEEGLSRELQQLAVGTPVAELLEGIFGLRRSLYKRIIEFSWHQHPDDYQRLARKPYAILVQRCVELTRVLGQQLGISLQPTDLLLDAPPVHREIEFDVPIYFPREKTYRRLDEVSPVVAALAHTQFDDLVKRVRIFAHPRVAGELQQIPDLSERIRAILREIE